MINMINVTMIKIKLIIKICTILIKLMQIQEVKLSAALEVKGGVGALMTGLVEGIENRTNRFDVDVDDLVVVVVVVVVDVDVDVFSQPERVEV